MTVLITLTAAGADTGPFDLYSNADGFVSAFETNVPKSSLLAGYASALVPNSATVVRVKSKGDCTNYIDLVLGSGTTTTTSTTLGAVRIFMLQFDVSPTSICDNTTVNVWVSISDYNIMQANSDTLQPGITLYTNSSLTVPYTAGSPSYVRYNLVTNDYNSTNGVVGAVSSIQC